MTGSSCNSACTEKRTQTAFQDPFGDGMYVFYSRISLSKCRLPFVVWAHFLILMYLMLCKTSALLAGVKTAVVWFLYSVWVGGSLGCFVMYRKPVCCCTYLKKLWISCVFWGWMILYSEVFLPCVPVDSSALIFFKKTNRTKKGNLELFLCMRANTELVLSLSFSQICLY